MQNSHHSIVFIHGFGGSSTAWQKVQEFLPRHSSLTFDLRGHGQSKREKSIDKYTIDYFETDLDTFLKTNSINKCYLVGHCFGGLLAITYAKKNPQKIAALILINSADRLPLQKLMHSLPNSVKSAIRSIINLIPDVGKSSLPNYGKFVNTADFSPRRLLSDIAHTHLHAYFSIFTQMFFYNFSIKSSDHLPPTLIIQGGKDRVIPEHLTKGLQSRHHHISMVTIPSGHIAPISHPQEVANQIKSFLSNGYH